MPVLLGPVNNFLGQVIGNASEGKYNTVNNSSKIPEFGDYPIFIYSNYTRTNQKRMFFVDFPVNYKPILMKFCRNHFSTNIPENFVKLYSVFQKLDYLTCGLTTLNKPKSKEVSTNDGIITQNIFDAAVPTSIETK